MLILVYFLIQVNIPLRSRNVDQRFFTAADVRVETGKQ